MAHKTILTTVLAGLILAAGGCSNALKSENALLLQENQMLRTQLDDRTSALDMSDLELRDRNAEVAQLRLDIDQHHSSPATTGFEGIAGVSGRVQSGEVVATVDSDVLFGSGKAALRGNAKKSLDAVASVLNRNYDGRDIRIAGHTDSDPIRKSGFKSNHHLAFERSFAVRDYLVSRGINSERIYVASHGPDRPAGSKAQSRRVDIIVVMN